MKYLANLILLFLISPNSLFSQEWERVELPVFKGGAIPINKTISRLEIYNNIIKLKKTQLETVYYNIEDEEILKDTDFSGDVPIEKYFQLESLWDYSFQRNKSSLTFYDDDLDIEETLKFEPENFSYYNIFWVVDIQEDFALIQSNSNYFKIFKEGLELEKYLELANNELLIADNMNLAIFNKEKLDSGIFSYKYTFDNKETWEHDTIKGNLIRGTDPQVCFPQTNIFPPFILDQHLVFISTDSVHVSKIGASRILSSYKIEVNEIVEGDNRIFLLNNNSGVLYSFEDSGSMVKIDSPFKKDRKIRNICKDKNYLYATDRKEVYRLKLDK